VLERGRELGQELEQELEQVLEQVMEQVLEQESGLVQEQVLSKDRMVWLLVSMQESLHHR